MNNNPLANLSCPPVVNITQGLYYYQIQDAIDEANPDDIISCADGTYYENIDIDLPLTLYGTGAANTIIEGAVTDNVISITAGGSSAMQRLTIRDLKVTSPATTGGVNHAGIEIDASGGNTLQYFTFKNLSIVDNNGGRRLGTGIYFRGVNVATDIINDIEILGCDISNNSDYGINTKYATVNNLFISDDGAGTRTTINYNNYAGIMPDGASGNGSYNNWTIQHTDLTGNNTEGDGDYAHGDIVLFGYNGDLTLNDINCYTGVATSTFTYNQGWMAITIWGDYSTVGPAGRIDIDNVNFYDAPGANYFPRASLGIWTYNNTDDLISISGCLFNASNSQFGNERGGLYISGVSGSTPITLENTTFNGNYYYQSNLTDIVLTSSATVNVDATTNNTFTGAADNFDIEDRIYHSLDAVGPGLVTWIASNVWVTTNTLGIQRGIDVVPNSTVNVDAGTFTENITIDKPIHLIGQGSANTILDASGGAYGIAIESGGTSVTDRLLIKDLQIKDATSHGMNAYTATGLALVIIISVESCIFKCNWRTA